MFIIRKYGDIQMYRTNLDQFMNILEQNEYEVALSEIRALGLTQDKVNIIEFDMEKTELNDPDDDHHTINEFNIFTKSGTVIFGISMKHIMDFTLQWAAIIPNPNYELL